MADQPPRVRFSLLWKITLPFMLLAMLLGLGAALLVNDLLSQEETDRFLRQLVDAGQQATDAVVRSEIDLLEPEPLIANTHGVAEAVAAGNTYFSSGVSDVLMRDEEAQKFNSPLTTREQSVLLLVAEGKSSRDVAQMLQISTRTVETHRKNIKKKLFGSNMDVLLWLLLAP